jgi:hypothetical protein
MSDSEVDDDIESVDEPQAKKRGRTATSSTRDKASRKSDESSLSQSQLSFQPAKRKTRRKPTPKKYTDDDSGDEELTPNRRHDMEDGWGTAKTDTFE